MQFSNMRVGQRLAVVFGAVLGITVLSATLSLFKISAMQDNLRQIVLEENKVTALSYEMSDAIHVVVRLMRSIVLMQNQAEREEALGRIKKERARYDQAWEDLQKFPSTENSKAIRERIAQARDHSRPINNRYLELAMKGETAEAVQLLFREVNQPVQAWQDLLDENIKYENAATQKHFEEAEMEYQQAWMLLVMLNIGAIVGATLLGWRVTQSITKQLGGEPGEAVALAQAVAAGDLTHAVQVKPGDTHSVMAQLKVMQDGLVQVVAKVRMGADGISTASTQIASGNQDLSSRTEDQASSLEETASAMEQLSATVNHNADNARQANQLALDASSVAEKGGHVVEQVVGTMRTINESSRQIADILGVIDSIAFQTNILALNAAVEAARAGEQGRGFAVVASEVRSLAGRSAEAAKEIKALIQASVERVEHGTALVDEAGSTMGEVVASIKRVTDLMGEISAASNEQAMGVGQVGQAVTQIDQVTQQNAALVEEMAAAASSLKAQAKELVNVVSVFKVTH